MRVRRYLHSNAPRRVGPSSQPLLQLLVLPVRHFLLQASSVARRPHATRWHSPHGGGGDTEAWRTGRGDGTVPRPRGHRRALGVSGRKRCCRVDFAFERVRQGTTETGRD